MLILSKLRRAIGDLHALIFPPTCPVCNATMREGEQVICNRCRVEMPMTGYIGRIDNAMERRLWGLMPFVQAAALYFYIEGSPYRRIIHAFKYGSKWRLARDMGEWLGGELVRSRAFDEVDVIVPVPLHPLRRMWRGYNQSEYLAEGVAKALGRPIDSRSLRRTRYTTSQVRRAKNQRWENVHGRFAMRRGASFAGRHVLLVDDVFTKGETLCACADAILREAPDCQISVITLAVSQREVADIF